MKQLSIHMAPLQGYTEAAYRNAHAASFGGIAHYYTPFVRIEKDAFRAKDLRDIDPANNEVPHLVPQRKAIRKPTSTWAVRFLCLLNGIRDRASYPTPTR